MIVIEHLDDGRTYTYSDAGFKIMQETGIVYEDALDVVEHTYTETDQPIAPVQATAEEIESALEAIL